MSQEAGRAIFLENGVNLLSFVEHHSSRPIQLQRGQQIIVSIRREFEAVAVDDLNLSAPFGIFLRKCFHEQQRIEGALLERNIGVHDDDIHGTPIGGWNPFKLLLVSILSHKTRVPYVGNHATVFNGGTIQDGGIFNVLFVVRTCPNLVDFADDMVIEKHSTVVLDGFNVNIENVSEIQFGNLGADGTKVSAGHGIQAHPDFNERVNGKLFHHHFLCGDGAIGCNKCFLFGSLNGML